MTSPQHNENTDGKTPNPSERSRLHHWLITFLDLLITLLGVLSFILSLVIPKSLDWQRIVVGVVCLFCIAYSLAKNTGVRKSIFSIIKRIYGTLLLLFIISILVMTILIYQESRLIYESISSPSVQVTFNPARGSLYNSWQKIPLHLNPHNDYIIAEGVNEKDYNWIIPVPSGITAGFKYRIDPSVIPIVGASSGGYVMFYNTPADRLRQRTLHFKIKAVVIKGSPDIGVRLVADDPTKAIDKEQVVYELSSVKSLCPIINNKWCDVEVHMDQFDNIRLASPLPPGIDENTINKLVFFIDTQIAADTNGGTLWFSDVKFSP